MCGINPSHNTPNQQRIRGTLLCPSMSIFMHWLVKSSRTQEWTGHIHVRKGMGGTPGRSNLNKLHIFEPVSQCSLPYDGVHDTPQ